jgi:PIN domain nuclease of toxin-antitoxin system
MILADTNVVLRLAFEPELLSKAAVDALREARISSGGLAIAAITLWEIALLVGEGKIALQIPLLTFLRSLESTYSVLPANAEVAACGTQFTAAYPRDPADRLIGATALVHGLQLVTADKKIRASGEVPVVW